MRTSSKLYAEPKLPLPWNITVAISTSVAIVLLIINVSSIKHTQLAAILTMIDLSLCVVFGVDILWRIRRSGRPKLFLRHDGFDLISLIPAMLLVYLGPLAWLVRVLRLLSLARRLGRRFGTTSGESIVDFLGTITFTVWFTTASLFYLVEKGVNDKVLSMEDAFWWSIVTLSTVGYGDITPVTHGGRLVGMLTMVLGIGVLGAFAGALGSFFMSARDRKARGLGSVRMKGHLLICGFNDKTERTLAEFRQDRRFAHVEMVLIADDARTPIEDERIRFISGAPSRDGVLERGNVRDAGAAIVFARNPHDVRSDHETILVVQALRRKNKEMMISAELLDMDNEDALKHADCDAIVHTGAIASGLLARGAQDEGVVPLFIELVNNKEDAEIYRWPIDAAFAGRTYRELTLELFERNMIVLGLIRDGKPMINPPHSTHVHERDVAYVLAHEPP